MRRLASERLEPTPENYLKAYHAEAGTPEPVHPAAAGTAPTAGPSSDGQAWADLISRVLRGVERSSRLWTTARKKDSVKRVLEGSASNPERLQKRLRQLMASWDGETPESTAADAGSGGPDSQMDSDFAALISPEGANAAPTDMPALDTTIAIDSPADGIQAATPADQAERQAAYTEIVKALSSTVQCALPGPDEPAREAAGAVRTLTSRLKHEDSPPADLARAFDAACQQAQMVLQHRQHMLDQLGVLCHELTDSLADLTEDDSWVRGQCEVMRQQLDEGMTARSVRHISQLLHDTRVRQRRLRAERDEAKRALQSLIHQMLSEMAELGGHTGRFQTKLGEYAHTIGQAKSLESLTGVVREMVEETRSVQGLVSAAQQRLQSEHGKATELSDRVRQLEDEIRRLSDEVSTDPLTQIANRRGLMRAFEAERARADRTAAPLAIALLDIDNFKRLNDQLGHQTGDEALKFLADRVKKALRPSDVLARYGGEEFVVLLPATPLEEAQAAMTRLQRTISSELFMQNEGQQVFITFSAGVTLYRADEAIEAALDRADVGLYEAKRTGKNRTCSA